MPGALAVAEEQRAAHLIRRLTRPDCSLSSAECGWPLVASCLFHQRPMELDLPPLKALVIGLHYQGSPYMERHIDGNWSRGRAAPRDLSFIPAHKASRWHFHHSFKMLLVCLNHDLLVRTAEENEIGDAGSLEIVPRFLVRDATIERIAYELILEMRTPGLATRLFAESSAQSLAIHVLRSHSNFASEVERSVAAAVHWKLRRATDFIEENLDRDISLADMAEIAGMSVFHFAKSFKESTGLAPHQYLTRRRMEKAKLLLQETDLEIVEITQEIGLGSQSHFTSVFARHTGVTPRQFRFALRS